MAKPKSKPVAIVAYNGIDGACAAAAALLKFPAAKIRVTSARAVGQALGELAKGRAGEIHVCGVGALGEWGEVVENAWKIQKKGTEIIWYCGREYLDADRYGEVCTPVFGKAASNTAAVCRHLGLEGEATAKRLMKLARYDPNIELQGREPPEADRQWTDLIMASVGEYLKYQDRSRYVATIGKLARQEFDEADRRLVEVFRQSGFRHILRGKSAAMQKLRKRVILCAGADEPVLITGESGVGKESVAHLIHERSGRTTERFVVINCATFAGSVELANSTLFGHKKGAFTGALSDRAGAFREASGGVLFLDELAEMPLEVQAKLLRVLEDGIVTPVGADRPEKEVDVLVIAATNRDLPTMVRDGEFREDLYHRLSTLEIIAPPLREHPQDIEMYVNDELRVLAKGGKKRKLTDEELALLRNYDWPGNVRELKKVIRRCVYLKMGIVEALGEEKRLGSARPASPGDAHLAPVSIHDIRPFDEVRRLYVKRALALHEGNVSAAARAMKVTPKTLRAWVE